jgi:predicted lactoylglutathione lyase
VEQRITLVTLGVSDYARAKAFYEALGWSAALEVEETAFFQGNGVILCLWAREKVHGVIEPARANGAEITREPSETFYGGYAGAFRDLDGHAWEIAHNPGFGLDEAGNIVLPHP